MKIPTSPTLLFIIALILLNNTFVFAENPPPVPLNDDCTGAISITPTATNTYTSYDNLNSTVSVGVTAPPCASPMGGDVWFSVIVPASGHLIFDLKSGSMTDGGMAIYSGVCNNLFFIACSDNKSIGYPPNDNMPQIDKCGLNFNDKIYIRVWGKGAANFGTFQLSVIAAPLQAPCTNLGFENDYTGWFATLGQQYDGAVGAATPVYFPISFNNTNDPNFSIKTAAIDSIGGFPKVYSGLKSLKIGESLLAQTYDAASIEQTFTVGPMNTKFIYHYALVLQSGGHPTYEQPFFRVELFDANGNIDSCGLNTIAMPNSTLIPAPGSSSSYYKPWTTVILNLSAYSGQNITIRFTVSDCSPTGHFGYAYLDCECAPYAITGSQDTVCTGDSVTLTAPAGASSYLWSPGGATTQSIVVAAYTTTTYYCLVQASNTGNCTTNLSKTIYTSSTASAAPAAAGNITSNGNNIVSQGQNNVLYNVPPIYLANRYDWYYSGTGVTFYPSNKTTGDSVWLNFSSTATSGNLTVKGHNNCFDGAFSADYPISVSVGVLENNNDAQFSIYPNPAKDNLIIELNANNVLQSTSVSINNIQGQLIKQITIKESKTAIDIRNFATGVYIIKLYNQKETLVSRFVKD